jgi:class 3 adenylate cyclase
MTHPRGDVPTGTLTYLFTDIEGSTRLANQLGAAFNDQLGEHDRILRDAISANKGAVSSTAGDSFFVRFTNAMSAVRAAVAAQRGLNTHAWASEPFRARMGLHTAEASDEDEAYSEIARAARIMAAAHGGQVLLSNSTRELISAHLPD